jgi:uncharacterized protein
MRLPARTTGSWAILVAALLVAPTAAAARAIPALTGPVVDEAGALDAGWRSRLGALCRAAWDQPADRRIQLQYLLVRSLEGDALEDFSMRVAESWKLGARGKDNGVLVLVAVQDRKVRIEVGGGIEGGLTDVQSGRIIRDAIRPAFREQRYGEGLYTAGVQILSAMGALPAEVVERRPAAHPFSRGRGLPTSLLIFLGLAVVIGVGSLIQTARRGRTGLSGGGLGPSMGAGLGWGGGGGSWGGGGGDSSSWGGGGGGFSGGGASDSW